MTAALLDMWTVFRHSWPIWLFIAALTAYAVWACRENDRTKKAWRQDAARREAVLATLEHIAETDLVHAERAEIARRKVQERTRAFNKALWEKGTER